MQKALDAVNLPRLGSSLAVQGQHPILTTNSRRLLPINDFMEFRPTEKMTSLKQIATGAHSAHV